MDLREGTYRELREELEIAWDSYDPWGSAMSVFFAVAASLYYRGADFPDDWFYSPGAGDGAPEDGDYEREVIDRYPVAVVRRLGDVMKRYCGLLERHGRDY